MLKYVAYYAPGDSELDLTKGGFDSEEAAWGYIRTQLCNGCIKELADGFAIYGDSSTEEKVDISHPSETSCGAEWFVIEEEAYNRCEGFEDILDAAGWIKYTKENS